MTFYTLAISIKLSYNKHADKERTMGQYYMLVNLDKKQYIHPHAFGDGLKLLEFGSSGEGTMCALAILLASGNGRGGGDLYSENPIVGSWAGDRIVISGDYDDDGKWDAPSDQTLYSYVQECFEDVSVDVMSAMAEDVCLRKALIARRDGFSAERWVVFNLLDKEEKDGPTT